MDLLCIIYKVCNQFFTIYLKKIVYIYTFLFWVFSLIESEKQITNNKIQNIKNNISLTYDLFAHYIFRKDQFLIHFLV